MSGGHATRDGMAGSRLQNFITSKTSSLGGVKGSGVCNGHSCLLIPHKSFPAGANRASAHANRTPARAAGGVEPRRGGGRKRVNGLHRCRLRLPSPSLRLDLSQRERSQCKQCWCKKMDREKAREKLWGINGQECPFYEGNGGLLNEEG